jgi:hypothetical protein
LSLSSGRFPSGFPTTTLCTPLLSPRTCYMPRQSQYCRFDHPNNIWCLFHCSGRTKVLLQVRGTCGCFVGYASFYSEKFSAPRQTPKLEDHPLSAVRDC